jgi:hypothetical protein
MYTLIPLVNAASIIQVNVTKNESTYTTSGGNAQIAVVCGTSKSACIGLAFEGGVLKSVRNVSITSETGPVKMVTVSDAVAIAQPVASPIVAPAIVPVAEPVVTPVVAPIAEQIVTVVPEVATIADSQPVETIPVVDAVNQTEALTALFTSLYESATPSNGGGFLATGGESESTSWYSAIWIIITLCVLGAAYDTFGRALMQSLAQKRSSFKFTSSVGLSRKKSVQERLLSSGE